ncbi:MAG: hypothetical protein ABIY63_11660 [Fibrobacteria bacterium]
MVFFCACLAFSLVFLEIYARSRLGSTPAGQALSRYQPYGRAHAVFLGSSLTDAGIRVGQLDSLQRMKPDGYRSFNLALAGLSGSDNYYLLFRNFILPRSTPRFLVVEAPGIPFFPPAEPFDPMGNALRVESFRTDLMGYADLRYLADGWPGPAGMLAFWMHKHWRAYHYRLELQARLRERLQGWERNKPADAVNSYRMATDAYARFAEGTREHIRRLEIPGEGMRTLHGRNAHLLDLAAAANAAGVRLVVLKPPCPPMDQVTARSRAFAEYLRGFKSVCDSLGVAYLDLSLEEECGPYSYSDGIHLDVAGAEAFTACVSRMLPLPLPQPLISRP